jgi:hypothetical protein
MRRSVLSWLALIKTYWNGIKRMHKAKLSFSHGPVRLMWKSLSRLSAKNPGAIWRVISCPLSAESRLLSGMTAADRCPELQELKRQYESALRAWGSYEFPLHNEPVGTRARRFEHLRLKQEALGERNAANDHVLDHKRICQLCSDQGWLSTHKRSELSRRPGT